MARVLRFFGYILCLGGVAHCVGVLQYYHAEGMPEANRVLLDIWIGAAHIVGGILFIAAAILRPSSGSWRTAAYAGAATVLTYTVPFIPVLVARDPRYFLIPPTVYTATSIFIVLYTIRQKEAVT